jgi:hypothetical protein
VNEKTPGQADDKPFRWEGTMAEFDAEVRRRWIEASERLGLDHGMPNAAAIAAQQPQARSGQAVYETWRAATPDWVCNVPGGPWEGLPETVRAGFDAIAAQAEAAGQVVRDILESLCRRDGLPVGSAVTPGEPAANYELAGRLGIGHVFGLPGEAPAAPQPAPELADAMRETRELRALAADILGTFEIAHHGDQRRSAVPRRAFAKWRERAGLPS